MSDTAVLAPASTASLAPPRSKAVVTDGSTLTFPEGLPGLKGATRWQVLAREDAVPFLWLESLDRDCLRLLAIDPRVAIVDYEATLTRADRARIGLADRVEPLLLAVCTICEDGNITANLRAPICVNVATMVASQIVLESNHWPIRHLLGRREA